MLKKKGEKLIPALSMLPNPSCNTAGFLTATGLSSGLIVSWLFCDSFVLIGSGSIFHRPQSQDSPWSLLMRSRSDCEIQSKWEKRSTGDRPLTILKSKSHPSLAGCPFLPVICPTKRMGDNSAADPSPGLIKGGLIYQRGLGTAA